jgi:hypothetical protein
MTGPVRHLARCHALEPGRPHRQRREAAILRHADGPADASPADDTSPAYNAPSGPLGITRNQEEQ